MPTNTPAYWQRRLGLPAPPSDPIAPRSARLPWAVALVALALVLAACGVAWAQDVPQEAADAAAVLPAADTWPQAVVALAAAAVIITVTVVRYLRSRDARGGPPPAPLALLLCLALCVLPGCASGLQASYVTAMEEIHEAIVLDVKKGVYKADEKSHATIDRFGQANADARAVLEEEAR